MKWCCLWGNTCPVPTVGENAWLSNDSMHPAFDLKKKKMPPVSQLNSSSDKLTPASSDCHISMLFEGLLYSSVSHMYWQHHQQFLSNRNQTCAILWTTSGYVFQNNLHSRKTKLQWGGEPIDVIEKPTTIFIIKKKLLQTRAKLRKEC